MPRWRHVSEDSAASGVSTHPSKGPRSKGEDGEDGLELRPTGASARREEDDGGWDSCDEDFEDYMGIGVMREAPPSKPPAAAAEQGCVSFTLSDGTTATVDVSAARRRLLGGASYDLRPKEVEAPQEPESEGEEEGGGPFAIPGLGSGGARGSLFGGLELEEEEEGGLGGRGPGVGHEEEVEELCFQPRASPFPTNGDGDEDDDGAMPFIFPTLPAEGEDEEEPPFSSHARPSPPTPPPAPKAASLSPSAREPSPAAGLGSSASSAASSERVSVTSVSTPVTSGGAPPALSRAPMRSPSPSPTTIRRRYGKVESDDEGPERAEEDEGLAAEVEALGGVLVEDAALPEIYPPGKIVHIYRCVFVGSRPSDRPTPRL
jgi:hypothetical protein